MKVLFCLPGSSFSELFLQAWTMTVRMMHREGIEYQLSSSTGSEICGLRNRVAGGTSSAGEYQVAHPGADYTHQVWIDSDMVWSPLDILTLLESPHPIYSGLYADVHGETTAFSDQNATRVKPHQGEVDVYGVGFGFIKIEREVFEKIPYPWFRLMRSEVGGNDSEDISFCRLAREAGYRVVVNTDMIIGHEKPQVVTPDGIVKRDR